MFDILFTIGGLGFSPVGLIVMAIFAAAVLTRDKPSPSKKQASASPRDASLTQHRQSSPSKHRQLQKQLAQSLPKKRRNMVLDLDQILDQERDYNPPMDTLASLPDTYRQQVSTNLGPMTQEYIGKWLNNANEMNLLIDERRQRLTTEISITRDLIAKLPQFIEARKLLIAELKQARQDLTALADGDPFWEQLVDEEFNGLMAEIVGGFGSKLSQEELRMYMLADRQDKHHALKSNSESAPPKSTKTEKADATNEVSRQVERFRTIFSADEPQPNHTNGSKSRKHDQ